MSHVHLCFHTVIMMSYMLIVSQNSFQPCRAKLKGSGKLYTICWKGSGKESLPNINQNHVKTIVFSLILSS